MNVVRFLRTGRLYPSGKIPGIHFCYRLSQPQGHSANGRIMSMKNSNIMGNRTRDLPACSAVPHPTAPPCAPPPRAKVMLKMLGVTGICEPLLWAALGDQSCARMSRLC